MSSCGVHARMPDSFSAAEAEPRPTLVTLLGELDLSTGAVLRECFARIDGSIEVDCSGLDFVDAQGLGIFVTARSVVSADTYRVRARRADQVAVEVAPDHGP